MKSVHHRLPPAAPLALLVLVGTGVAGFWALTTDEWRVMTDELGYVKSALSMGDHLSLRPELRGVTSQNYGVLYPALLAPLVSLFDMPTAFRLAHGLGALMMASTAIPAYLLATFVSRSRAVGLAAAAPVAVVPWVLLSMNLLTEAAAYPVFAWAVYASVLAVAEPSAKRDTMVLGACLVAFLTRTQFIFLVPLVPAMVVLHEVGIRVGGLSPLAWPGQAWQGLRAAVSGHRVLSVAVLVGLAFMVFAFDRVPLGDYGAVRSAKLFPDGFWPGTLENLNQIVFGIGVLPLTLTLAYVGENLVRPRGRRDHALAIHAVVVVPALVAVATSFDLSFAGPTFNERYLFYIAPLLLVAAVCYLPVARWPLRALGASSLLTGLALSTTAFEAVPDGAVFGSPARVAWPVVDGRMQQIWGMVGIDPANGVVLALGAALVVAVVAWLLRTHRNGIALAGFGVGVAAWCLALTLYSGPKVQAEHEGFAAQALGHVPSRSDRDWIDKAVSDDASVALLPSAVNARSGRALPVGTVTDQGVWWQAEFWNKSVRRSYLYAGAADQTPYTSQMLRLNRRSGRLKVAGTQVSYLVAARSNVLLGVRGAVVRRGADLDLVRLTRPYRARWATRGITNQGVLPQRRPAELAVYGLPGSGGRNQIVTLSFAGQTLGGPMTVRGTGIDRKLAVFGRATVTARLCVPTARPGTLRLQVGAPNKVRLVGVRVRMGAPCQGR